MNHNIESDHEREIYKEIDQMGKDNNKNCTTCAWNSGKGTCSKLGIVPMSLDGKGVKNCVNHESIGGNND